MAKDRVFLDSSVLIAATLSSSGGSFYILSQLHKEFVFKINEYVFEETSRVLAHKFFNEPRLKSALLLLLGLSDVSILPNPPTQKSRSLSKIINSKDAPISASALENSNYLLTLDADFLDEDVVVFAKARGLVICNPKEFILLYRMHI